MVAATGLSPNSELGKIKILEDLVRKGFIDKGSIGAIRPFRISTVQEMVCLRVVVSESSGLKQKNNEFVENPWGFPFVPVPDWNTTQKENRMRLAPNRISYEWFGYPIYWIDPQLTMIREDERSDPARWTVRMYYLMLAFGLLEVKGSTIRWVNALRARGYAYSEEDWENYARGYDTEADGIVYTEKDLKVPLAKVEEAYREALKHISRIQKREIEEFKTQRAVAYRNGVSLVKDVNKEDSRVFSAVRESTILTKCISKIVLDKTPVKYQGEVIEGISQLVNPLFVNVRQVVTLIKEMDAYALILNAPIIRESTISRLQFSAIATSLSNYHSYRVTDKVENKLNRMAQELAAINDQAPTRDFSKYQLAVQEELDTSWKKVQLALANYNRVEEGKTPFATLHEMQAHTEMSRSRERKSE